MKIFDNVVTFEYKPGRKPKIIAKVKKTAKSEKKKGWIA
jgi:hypothetical protein